MPKQFEVTNPTMARVERLTRPLAAALQASASGTAALPLTQGEWLSLAGDVLSRPAAGAGITVPTPTFPYFPWTNQFDVQGGLSASVLIPPFQGWSLVWDSTIGIPAYVYGAVLEVAEAVAAPFAGYNALAVIAGAGFVVGWVMAPLPTVAASPLYFRLNY